MEVAGPNDAEDLAKQSTLTLSPTLWDTEVVLA